ncbi:MAG: hypothetical protein WBD71_10105 [Xanthobacteraceae bacterium]
MTSAIVARRIKPPAAPVKTPKKAAANDAADKPRKSSGPISGALKKCMFVLIVWRIARLRKNYRSA